MPAVSNGVVAARRVRAAAVVAGVVAGLLAGCGSRLPPSAFPTGAVAVAGPAPGEVTTTTTTDRGAPGLSASGSLGGPATASAAALAGGPAAPGQVSLVAGGTAAVGGHPAADNAASDRGVTPGTLTLGLVVSRTNVLGADVFDPSLAGAQAYVAGWNARGGQHGRTVQLLVCDDQSSAAGNQQCVRSLLAAHVFAFVGNTVFNYDAASVVSQADVPDVGGQPVGNAYDTYAHLYSIYGDQYPRDGRTGFQGKLYGGDEDQQWFAQHLGVHHAAVVYYNQADSQRYAQYVEAALAQQHYQVEDIQVNFALPNFDTAALTMLRAGVDSVWDALDDAGNQGLCRSMDKEGVRVKAKVQTVQSWRQAIAAYHAPCRTSVWSTAKTVAYTLTSNPTVAHFRADMARYQAGASLAMWTFEGWLSVQWLDDALTGCAAAPTRSCLERFLSRPALYTAHGAWDPRNFVPFTTTEQWTHSHGCVSAAQWDDAAHDFVQRSNLATDCYPVRQIPYSP